MKYGFKRVDVLWCISGFIAVGYAFFVSYQNYHFSDVLINLASGYTSSIFFYFLLVWYPERQKRARVKRNIIKQYAEFKERVLGIIIHASGEAYGSDDLERLLVPAHFTEYYTGQKWYDFLNGLNPYYIGELVVAFECLRFEVNYVLDSIDVEDQEVFDFMKRLSKISREMMNKKADYDDQKILGRFLWQFFSDWDVVSGQLDHDPNLRLFERI